MILTASMQTLAKFPRVKKAAGTKYPAASWGGNHVVKNRRDRPSEP